MRETSWEKKKFCCLRKMPIKLFIDECINNDTATQLKSNGFDIVSVFDLGMMGASDDEVLAKAVRLKRVLLTYDRGFGDIFRYNVAKTWGVLIILITHMEKSEMANTALNFLTSARARNDDFKGILTIIGKNKIRRIR